MTYEQRRRTIFGVGIIMIIFIVIMIIIALRSNNEEETPEVIDSNIVESLPDNNDSIFLDESLMMHLE